MINVTIDGRTVSVGWLDAVRLVGSAAGFIDIDVEQFPTSVSIKLTKPDGQRSFRGSSLEDVCRRVLAEI